MARRLHSHAALAAALACSAYAALVFSGCSSDPSTTSADAGETESSVEASVDAPDDTNDGGGGCPDTPFDCSETAGDASTGTVPGTSAQQSVPFNLRCAGLYACWSNKTVAASRRQYSPAYVLYSDGADKTRWLYLPAGTQIDTGGNDAGSPDEWVFPVGTELWKEFKLAGKRVETRRLWKASASEWVYSVWLWSDDESSATLWNAGKTLPNPARPGKTYEIPAVTDCSNCHDGHTDRILSVDAWSLGAPGATGVTLDGLKGEGRLTSWPYGTSIASPEDSTGKFAAAQAWYYNNCGFCHRPGRPGGAVGLYFYLPVKPALYDTSSGIGSGGLPDGGNGLPFGATPIYTTGVNVASFNGAAYPSPTYARIKPHDVVHSVAPLRDTIRDATGQGIAPGQMPPVLQRTVDDAGVAATTDWINALP